MSETVRGGINSIDVGQIEGAKALGMGYVPMQMWGTIYPLARGFVRGTIFPSLDLPFAVGGAEDEGTISMQHDAGNAGRTCE